MSRSNWLTRKLDTTHRNKWTPSDIERLRSLVGKASIKQIARRLGKNYNSVSSKLMQLGYRVRDVVWAYGINAIELSRRLGISQCVVWHHVKAKRVKATRDGKDYIIRPREEARYTKFIRQQRARKEQALKRIKEPTITKQQLMKLLDLSETHASRYLACGVVRAYKVPTELGAAKWRWEWYVSERDAHRIKARRESGKLALRNKKYQAMQKKNNAEITRLRRERRLGLRDERHYRHAVLPDHFTVAQIARRVHLSESDVYEHVKNKRLPAARTKVGKQEFISIPQSVLPAYETWCSRLVKATGPLLPHQRQIQQIHAAGYLTIVDAAEKFAPVTATALRSAAMDKRIPACKIDGMIALREDDVRQYAKHFKPRKPYKKR